MADKDRTIFDAIIETPVAHLGLKYQNNILSGLEYIKPDSVMESSMQSAPAVLIKQIKYYFLDASYRFDLPIVAKGTDFQQQVWSEMRKIPAGEVRTYGEVAEILSTSPRAVGNACRANPVPLIIPCHRIVSATGLGGFAGARSGFYTDIKRQLLRHEGLEF